MRGPAQPEVALRAAVPTVLIRVLLAAVGVGLAALLLQGLGVVVGVLLALLAAVLPGRVAPWLLVAVLALGEALRDPRTVGAELLLLVAGVHALAALAELAAALPATGRLELAALRRPALRFLAVQVPVQALGLVVLLLIGRTPPLPAAAVGGAVLLVALPILLIGRSARTG